MNNDDRSYERYKNWQINKTRYKHESVGLVLFFGIGFFIGCKIYGFVGGMVGFFVFAILYYSATNRVHKKSDIYAEETKVLKSEKIEAVESSEKKEETGNMSRENKKTTEEGFINKNNQKNIGKTDMKGTDYGQYLYSMECLNCGHKYYANGSDIWLRKCPKCQNGAN